MTMKHLCILLFFAAGAVPVLSAADPAPSAAAPQTATVPAAAAPSAKPAELPPTSVLTMIYQTYPDPSAYADTERAGNLLKRRAELIEKIHKERKRLLEEDATAKKLRDEILLLNRRLASLLEDKKSMIELKSQLDDVDFAISRLKLKPVPQPPPATEPGETPSADADANKASGTPNTRTPNTRTPNTRTPNTRTDKE